MYVCNVCIVCNACVYVQKVIEIQVSQFATSAVKFNQKSSVRKIIITSMQDELRLKMK